MPEPGLLEATGLMSVKPSRSADDGAAMVGWALLGCISDIGGFMTDLVDGVRGLLAGEDMMALRLCVGSLTGLSSRSATDSSVGLSGAMGSACNARSRCEQWRDVLLRASPCLFTYLGGAGQACRSATGHGDRILEVDTRRGQTSLNGLGSNGRCLRRDSCKVAGLEMGDCVWDEIEGDVVWITTNAVWWLPGGATHLQSQQIIRWSKLPFDRPQPWQRSGVLWPARAELAVLPVGSPRRSTN